MKESGDGETQKMKKTPTSAYFSRYVYVLMAAVGTGGGIHSCAALEIEARERTELGWAIESEAVTGSVHERVGDGSGSCSGGRTGGGNWGHGKCDWKGCT